MEKQLINPYDKEYMKMAMLKHEETFKKQVSELHRLYRMQKILMKSIENRQRPNKENQEGWDSRSDGIRLNQMNDHHHHHHHNTHHKPPPRLDLEQPAEDYIAESDEEREPQIEDESEIQLTLGPTSYYCRRKIKVETPGTSDSGPSFSSSSTGSSNHMKRTHQLNQFCSGTKNGFEDVKEQLNQDRLKQPSWLFQPLSLKFRT